VDFWWFLKVGLLNKAHWIFWECTQAFQLGLFMCEKR